MSVESMADGTFIHGCNDHPPFPDNACDAAFSAHCISLHAGAEEPATNVALLSPEGSTRGFARALELRHAPAQGFGQARGAYKIILAVARERESGVAVRPTPGITQNAPQDEA